MTKRNITIFGIVLILIAIILISRGGARVESPSAEVREPVALEVVDGVVEQASVDRLTRREAANEMVVPTRTLDVVASVDTVEEVTSVHTRDAVASLSVNKVDLTVDDTGRVAERGKQVNESAAVLRANVRRADQDRAHLV